MYDINHNGVGAGRYTKSFPMVSFVLIPRILRESFKTSSIIEFHPGITITPIIGLN